MNATQKQVIKWLAHGNTGASSKCMAFYLAFGEVATDRYAPADPADFNRCLQLLEYAPQLRPLIPRMAKVSDQWARVVAHWDEIELTFLEEAELGWTRKSRAPETFDLMYRILRPQQMTAKC